MTVGPEVQLECWHLSRGSLQKSLRKGNLEKELKKIQTQKKTDLGLCSFLFSYITKYYKIKNCRDFTLPMREC